MEGRLITGIIVGAIVAIIVFTVLMRQRPASSGSDQSSKWRSNRQADASGPTWPTTSPTANTEAPNPTDPPASEKPAADGGDTDKPANS